MPEGLSDAARLVVGYAERHARTAKHQYIGTEHLLLGLVEAADRAGTGRDLEALLGISSAQIRGAVVGVRGLGVGDSPRVLPYSSEALAVLDLASKEAGRLGLRGAEPEHILLALTTVDAGTGVDVLRANGVDLDRVRHSVIGARQNGHPEPAGTPGLIEAVTRVVVPGPVIGRASEIDQVIRVLTRRHRNVPLLVGEPGVGKKTIAVGVASAIAQGRLPAVLRDHTVRALDLGTVLADPQHRARGGALIADLIDEFRSSPRIVLHLDGALTPLHLSEGVTTPLDLFRPVLHAPGVFVLGDCGRAQYERARDPGLDRIVQPVVVTEPSDEDVGHILRDVCRRLENHHGVLFFTDALEAAATLARDHVPDRPLPGSAIGLLDEAAALVRMEAARSDTPPDGAPQPVMEHHVRMALAAYSGIRTSPRGATPPAPAEHDPSVWAMS
ncbi:Clp protease N-terminal domain-containing protein [Streptomyces sp. NPDC001544]|uniref:Clp protease N-terminal domain-containing protein n=1 Tax=Streptomyces sp. NPDC001544 TaxID=3364584 RepID=UPI00368C4658